MSMKLATCCQNPEDCCPEIPHKKVLKLEYLYLDLNSCQRCVGSDRNIENALRIMNPVLHAIGFDIQLSKIKIDSVDLAVKHRFMSSPTLRINGNDVGETIEESDCIDCGDLCHSQVDCRQWTYRGKTYTELPQAYVIDAVFKTIYGPQSQTVSPNKYVLPVNLKRFFDGKQADPKDNKR